MHKAGYGMGQVNLQRPPRSKRETISALQEADRRYKQNEKYLLGKSRHSLNHEKAKADSSSSDNGYLANVPKGISFARLVYPPNNAEVIVCGVKRRALLHSSFAYDMLVEFQPECTFIEMEPDNPMFIKPAAKDTDYLAEWHQFIRYGKNSSFHVNPKPKYANDLILTRSKVKSLVHNCLKSNPYEFEIGPKVIYSQNDLKFQSATTLASDAYLTSLLYPYNTLSGIDKNPQVIAIGDMPMLVQREIQARALSVG